ncbi:MAG: glycosyltransferase family 9 protein [Neisseriaceae bacterium]
MLIKSIIKLLILAFSPTFIKKAEVKPKTILIIRLDGFGDYIIFRNYLYWLTQNAKYSGYSITLVGNIIWKEFAEYFDKDIVNNFIWVDRNQFIKNFNYRKSKLQEICKLGYEIVLYPTHLRETMFGDSIAKAVSSPTKIASQGDEKYRFGLENKITNKIYTDIISANNKILFEFDRINEFFANWQQHPINNIKLELKYNNKAIFTFDYVVFFIGASSSNRKWPISHFITLAQMIYETYNIKIIFCGPHEDANLVKQNYYNDHRCYLINMVGKTSQIDLINILKYAKFVVSNETVVPHLCIALDTCVFVIYNGNNFKRFTPYPKHITNKYYAINHPKIDENPVWYTDISNKNNYTSKLKMEEISVEMVYNKILRNYL